jgi:AcrR family transcriptional regulator
VVIKRVLRADAAANRERILTVAALAVRRDGESVPLATVAAEAGVGVATLYRSFASREALLGALTQRSLKLVLDAATHAAHEGRTAIESLALFLYQTISHGPELVLPLHGGPVIVDPDVVDLRAEVHAALEEILARGRRDGTVSDDVTAVDVVLFGAFLARPLPRVTDWNSAARRQVKIFLSGVSPVPADLA